MYIPSKFNMDSKEDIFQFIEEYSFASLVSMDPEMGFPTATHMPLIIKRDEGEFGTLYGHLARANPHSQLLDEQSVLAMFHGPHAYISPSWYKRAPAVPTWNYAAVHVMGKARVLNDDRVLSLIEEMTATYEPALMENREIVTENITEKLLPAIVGFKIEISALQGKQKLGQNLPSDTQKNMADALSKSSHEEAKSLYAYMQRTEIGLG